MRLGTGELTHGHRLIRKGACVQMKTIHEYMYVASKKKIEKKKEEEKEKNKK